MKRFLLALFVAWSWATVAPAAEEGAIHGSVAYIYNGVSTPVSSVTIEVRENDYRESVMSDAHGNFTLLGLPPGPATIFVTGLGWMPEIFSWCVRAHESDAIPVRITNHYTVIPNWSLYYSWIERRDRLRMTTDQYIVGGC
jgi:hypothetical protein